MADDQKETNSKLTEVNRKLTEISSKLGNVTDATNENTKEQKKRGPRGPYAKDGAKTAERTADAAEKTAEEAKKEGKKSSSKESRERALLGQSQKQYEETVKQREIAAEAKKEMANIGSTIKGDAKNNKQYQESEKKFNKEQSKAQKLEGRRNLLSRFKDTKEKGGTGAAVKELGGTAMEGIGKTFKGIGGFLGKFSKIFALLVIPALVLLVNSPAWDWLKDFAISIVKFFSDEGPLGSFLKPILEFFGVGGSFDGVMTGIQVGFATLVAGLAAAVVFAPFKVMGGIANIGLFIGKKLFNLVKSVTKALLPKKAVASATKGATKGAAGAPAKKAVSSATKGATKGAATKGATKGAATKGATKGAARAAAPTGGSTSKPPKVPKTPKAPTPKMNSAKALLKIGSKFKNIGKLLKIVGKGVPGLGLLLASAEGISILMSDASKEEKIKQLSGLLGGTMAASVLGFGGAALGTLIMPGIGTAVGGVLGGIGGYFGGDYVGQKLAGWMLGDDVEKDLTPKPAASAGAAAKSPAGSPMQKMGIAGGSMAASGMDLGDAADDISTSRAGKRRAKSGMLGGRRVGIGASAARRIRGAGQLEMDDFGGPGLNTLSPEKRIANARSITASGAPGGRAAPPPNIVSAPTQINHSKPTSNNTSNSPSLKPSGSAGAMAAGAGSMLSPHP